MNPTASWRIDLPINFATIRALSLNSRIHGPTRGEAHQHVKEIVSYLTHRIPRLRSCTVQLYVAFGDRRRRDADNLVGFAKSVHDGLTPRVVPDDTPEYMTKPTPIIVPPPAPRGVWIVITEGLS